MRKTIPIMNRDERDTGLAMCGTDCSPYHLASRGRTTFHNSVPEENGYRNVKNKLTSLLCQNENRRIIKFPT